MAHLAKNLEYYIRS